MAGEIGDARKAARSAIALTANESTRVENPGYGVTPIFSRRGEESLLADDLYQRAFSAAAIELAVEEAEEN